MDDINIKTLTAEMKMFMELPGIKYFGYSLSLKEAHEVVNRLEKLEKIEKIVSDWKESTERDIEIYDTLEEIKKILEQE